MCRPIDSMMRPSHSIVNDQQVNTLWWGCGGSQKSFRLMGLYSPVEPFEGLNISTKVPEARV